MLIQKSYFGHQLHGVIKSLMAKHRDVLASYAPERVAKRWFASVWRSKLKRNKKHLQMGEGLTSWTWLFSSPQQTGGHHCSCVACRTSQSGFHYEKAKITSVLFPWTRIHPIRCFTKEQLFQTWTKMYSTKPDQFHLTGPQEPWPTRSP